MFIACRHKKDSAPLGAGCHIALLTERKLLLRTPNYKHIAAPQQNHTTATPGPNAFCSAANHTTATPGS